MEGEHRSTTCTVFSVAHHILLSFDWVKTVNSCSYFVVTIHWDIKPYFSIFIGVFWFLNSGDRCASFRLCPNNCDFYAWYFLICWIIDHNNFHLCEGALFFFDWEINLNKTIFRILNSGCCFISSITFFSSTYGIFSIFTDPDSCKTVSICFIRCNFLTISCYKHAYSWYSLLIRCVFIKDKDTNSSPSTMVTRNQCFERNFNWYVITTSLNFIHFYFFSPAVKPFCSCGYYISTLYKYWRVHSTFLVSKHFFGSISGCRSGNRRCQFQCYRRLWDRSCTISDSNMELNDVLVFT